MPSPVPAAQVSATTGNEWFAFLDKVPGGSDWVLPSGYTVQPFPKDLNGDGMTDYAWLETRRTVSPAASGGKDETQYTLTRTLKYVLSMPKGGFSPPVTLYEKTSGPWPMTREIPFLENGFCILPGDFNGDGLPDFLVTDSADRGGSVSWTAILLRGQTTNIPTPPGSPATAIKLALPGAWRLPDGTELTSLPSPIAPADWTKAAEISAPGNAINSAGLQALAQVESGAFNVFALDLNQDGADDFVWYESGLSRVAAGQTPETIKGWWVAYSLGDGSFGSPQKLSAQPWQGLAALIEKARATDTSIQSGKIAPLFTLKNLRLHDVNGDGVEELIVEGGTTAKGILATADGAPDSRVQCPFPNLVTAITNGYGATSWRRLPGRQG